MSMGATARFAGFAVDVVSGEAARHILRLSLLDWAACAIGGADEPVARILRDMAVEDGGQAEASVVGAAGRLPARAAALVNGAASHALDFDDTHFAHIGHPSVAVIPAALAVAEKTGADDGAFADAALVGAELSVRLGVWLGRGHYQTGFHQTATAGLFGAAAAAGRLLGLDAGQMAHALGLAATRAAGLKSQFGTMGKPYHAGMAAAAGVECAALAARGFVSRPDGIECAQGFGATHAGIADAAAFDGMGEAWLFETVSHKFHACCHGTHAVLEALAGIAPGVTASEVSAVEIAVHPRWLTVCDLPEPATGLEAKFSFRLTAAMVLAGQDTGLSGTFTDAATRDPALVALRDRVRVSGDDGLSETAARVRVTGAGRVTEAAHDIAAPLAADVLDARLRAKAAGLLGAERAGALAAVTVEAPQVAGLAALLRG